MKKLVYILSCLVIVVMSGHRSVAQNYKWIQTIGAAEDEAFNTIALDAAGNFYVTGRFSGTVDFGRGETRSSINENEDAFFAKYNPEGNLLFVRQFSSNRSNGTSIRIDNKGNIYVSGVYRENLSFEGTDLKLEEAPGNNSNNIFIAKYNAAGNFVFAFKIGGAGDDKFPFFDVDNDENIYVSGVFDKPVSFFSSNQQESDKKNGLGGQDVFLAKYNKSGTLVFVKQIGGTNDENPNALALDGQNNIYITGITKSSNFDPDENPATSNNLQSSSAETDIFIAKYDKNGTYVAAKSIGGPGGEAVNGMYVSPTGEIYLTGQTDKEADFDPDAGKVIIGAHNQDIFIAKYFSDLKIDFARSYGSTEEEVDRGMDIAVDKEGKIYITGYFEATSLDLDPKSAGEFKNGGKSDGFWAIFDARGEHLFSRQISSVEDVTGKDIVVDPLGNIYIAGEFNSEATFESRVTRTSNGERDIFVLKYVPGIALSQTVAANATGATHLHAADLDGDGALDIISANLGNSTSFISWYKNDGTGKFTAQPVVADDIQTPRVVFGADMDNDGDRDILAAIRDNNLIVWYENQGGSFAKNTPNIISDAFPSPRSVYPVDLDGDGDLDVLAAFVGDVKITWFENRLNEASNDFSPLAIDETTVNAEWIYAADLDGDGDPDILTAHLKDNGQISWHENIEVDENTRTFTLRQEVPLANAEFVSAADLNNDGKPEVIGVSKDKISIFSIDGNGNFSTPKELGGISEDGAVSAADIDGDGDLDIVFASAGDNKIAWYENAGNATANFSIQHIITQQATGTRTVLTPDLNSDGLPDVVWGAETKGEIAWAKNQSFTPASPSLTTFSPASVFPGGTITLFGTNFGNAPVVTFEGGETPVQAADVTSDNSGGKPKLVVKVPETLPEGAYQIKVNNAGKVGISFDDLLLPLPLGPQVTTLNPMAGPVGTLLTITGKNFGSDATKVQVKFGDAATHQVTADQLKSNAEITIPVPDIAEAAYPVSIVVGSLTSNDDKTFTVQPSGTPVITALSVTSGAVGGKVTITGENFGADAGVVSVTFDETVAELTLKSDTEIEVTVPGLPGASYKIQVTKNGLASNEVDFTISGTPDTPSLSTIDPDTILVDTTPVLTITGTDFGNNAGDITVSFKDINNVATDVTENITLTGGTEISVTAPALAVGAFTVSVTVGETISDNTIAFTVQENTGSLPEISDFPSFANIQGTIDITGNNFGTAEENTTVTFSGNGLSAGGDITSLANDKITVEIPDNLTEGAYDVTVSVSGNTVTSSKKLTIDNTAPAVTATDIPPVAYLVPGAAKTFTVNAADALSGIQDISMIYFGIREEESTAQSASFGNNGDGTYTIDVQSLTISDELGLEFYFLATDSAGNAFRFPGATNLFLHKDGQNVTLPITKASNSKEPKPSDYNLVAVPLEELTRDQVFGSLGTFGGSASNDWWLFEYNAGTQSYTEVSSSAAALDPHKGYMLIFRNTVAIQPQGKVLPVTSEQPVTITLVPGFNVIGNPFPFNINWDSVTALNAGVQGVDQLKFRKFSQGNWSGTSNTFNAFTGALVINPTSTSITLEIPYKKADTGSRYAQEEKKSKPQPLDAIAWEVPLQIETGERYTLGGIGMHPEAAISYDRLDDFTVPRFIDHLEMNFHHPEFFLPKFTKDIVPTQATYTWEFEVASNLTTPEVTIQWENHYFGNNGQALMLLDLQNHEVVNMREATAYTFSVAEGTRKFKIFYGSVEAVKANMLPESIAVGDGFPNPVKEQFTLPVSLPKGKTHYDLQVEIYNLTGQLVRSIRQTALPAGYQTIHWDRQNQEGRTVSAGLYFYRVNINNEAILNNGRIIVQ